MSEHIPHRQSKASRDTQQSSVGPSYISHKDSNSELELSLLQHIPDALMAFDREWRCTYANEHVTQLLGPSRTAMLGNVIWDVFPEIVDTPLYKKALQAMQERIQIEHEYHAYTNHRWLHVHFYPIPEGLATYFQDVTDRKRIEEILQEREKRFRIAIENLLDCFGIYTAVRNSAGEIVNFLVEYVNQAACVNNDLTKEEQEGRLILDILPELRTTGLFTAYQRVIETGEPFTAEQFVFEGLWHGQETSSILEIRATRFDDNRLTVAWRDITEQMQSQMELQRSEAKMRRLIESNIIGVAFVDGDYFIEGNDAFLEMMGYTQEDLDNRQLNWRKMTPPEYAEQDERALQEILAHGACQPIEKEYYRKDGSRVPVIIGVARLPGFPIRSVGFIMDISARKELERRKDEFISIASHELKTPITALKGLVQLFRRKIDTHREADPLAYFERIEDQVNYLTRLIGDLLDVSKIRAGKLEYRLQRFSFDLLIDEIVEAFTALEDQSHTITITGRTDASIIGDPDRLRQVFTNLISNAIKYSPGEHRVDITLQCSEHTVTTTIRDYGMGIPHELYQKIFERFYRSNQPEAKKVPGLGMGLYIVHDIVVHHGGTIEVESEVGAGSTFIVTLPIEHHEYND